VRTNLPDKGDYGAPASELEQLECWISGLVGPAGSRPAGCPETLAEVMARAQRAYELRYGVTIPCSASEGSTSGRRDA
jgi:hypothetical protein